MRRKGPLLFALVALVLAVVAAWGANNWLTNQARRAAARQPPSAPVVVAGMGLPAGSKLEATSLVVQHWPLKNLPEGYFKAVKELDGRVLNGPVVKGEVILGSKLAAKGVSGGLSAVVPKGYRAMTVKVDEVIGVAGFVRAGDRVDVMVTLADGPFRDNPTSRVVLQNVPVLAVGAQVQDDDSDKSKKFRPKKVTVVTLQLNPAQGERLALSASEGKLLLALRNQGDEKSPETPGIKMTSLIASASPEPAPVVKVDGPPAPAPAPRPQVEVIKGIKRTVQQL